MRRTHAKAIPITVLLLVGLLVESSCDRSRLAIHNDASGGPSDAAASEAVPISLLDALATSADIAAYHEDSGAGTTTVAIEPGLASYSSFVSSVPGLPLKTVAGGAVPTNPVYRWRADYGWFSLWDSSDHKVTNQGNDFTVGEMTVYWSYFDIPADTSVPVLIRLDLLGDNAHPLASSTLTLTWTAQGGVKVN